MSSNALDKQALGRRLFAVRALLLDGTLAEIARTFREKDVQSLLLKGPAFARWLYEEPRRRAYLDIDLLVAPGSFDAAESALADLGFRSLPRLFAAHHTVWQRDGLLDVDVDLHHGVVGVGVPHEVAWPYLAKGAETIEVFGERLVVPGLPAMALTLGLQLLQDGGANAKHREDLRRALEKADFGVWQAAATLARELNAHEALGLGLRFVPGGREMADRLQLPAPASRRLLLWASRPPATAGGIERLVSTKGAVGKLRLLREKLAPSPEFMRWWFPPARRSRWGLAAGYAWRPIWLALKLPGGLRAWLKVARSAPGGSAAKRDRA